MTSTATLLLSEHLARCRPAAVARARCGRYGASRSGVAPWLFSDAVVCEMQQISAVGLVNLIIFLWVVGSIIATVTYPMY